MNGFVPPTQQPPSADLAALFDLTPDPDPDVVAPPQPRSPGAGSEGKPDAPASAASATAPTQGFQLQAKSRDLPQELTLGGAFAETTREGANQTVTHEQWATPAAPAAIQPAFDPAAYAQQNRRIAESARLWPVVDLVLTAVSADPSLQVLIAELELKRDINEDAAQRRDFFNAIKPKLALAGVQIPDPRDVEPILSLAYDEILGISVLGDLWRDQDITEIMVDRWDSIVVERNGKLENTPITFRDSEHANSIARALALRISDRAVSRAIPLVTAELPQARVTFAYGAVVKGGLSITIRKFRDLLTLDQLLRFESVSEEMVDFLKDAVEARAGILVSGGTGTGKTTIVNMVSSFIPDSERVITIEDAFELQLGNAHVVSLQTKEASSSDDTVNVSLADLLRNTLRMRPDRIIVGEIREGDGAVVMLSAANTGHDGTMTTIHANTPHLAVNERLVDLVRNVRASSADLAIKRSIASAFELVIQVTRGRGGRRYISEVSAVGGVGDSGEIELYPVFRADPDISGKPVFTKVGVPANTSLAGRLNEKGVLEKWKTQPRS